MEDFWDFGHHNDWGRTVLHGLQTLLRLGVQRCRTVMINDLVAVAVVLRPVCLRARAQHPPEHPRLPRDPPATTPETFIHQRHRQRQGGASLFDRNLWGVSISPLFSNFSVSGEGLEALQDQVGHLPWATLLFMPCSFLLGPPLVLNLTRPLPS